MGCFTMFRGKKKKSAQVLRKCNTFKETMPTKLPEPEDHASSLQSAPPSFRTGTKSVQLSRGMASGRVRALSAPSSLHVPDGDPTTSAAEPEKEEEFKSDNLVGKDQRVNPQPLPLPSPQDTSDLKHTGNFKSSALNGLSSSGTLPLPPSTSGGLRNFSYDEIAAACLQFSKDRRTSEGLSSMVYTASFGDNSSIKKIEATVSCIHHSNQGFKDFINELNLLASLHHPHLCKLLGFHAREGSHHRMLVFEKLYHGSLDRLLCGRSDGPLIDWGARMKVALCTAQGLAFLHEEGPFQAMYNEFSAANVQIDKDFSAKLSGYGCVSSNPEGEIPNTSAAANLSLETLEKGLLTPKSNVWSFGIFLLELLTGRRNLDPRHSREEGNLVKWSKPFLSDDCRLSLIVDSRLKGRFPPKAARTVADIALKCLQKEPSERPTMRAVVESLGNIQDMRHSNRFPLQEPVLGRKQMLRSPSLNGVVIHRAPRLHFSPSPPSGNWPSVSTSPPRLSFSSTLPPRSCGTTISLEDTQMSGPLKRPTSQSVGRESVEGF